MRHEQRDLITIFYLISAQNFHKIKLDILKFSIMYFVQRDSSNQFIVNFQICSSGTGKFPFSAACLISPIFPTIQMIYENYVEFLFNSNHVYLLNV